MTETEDDNTIIESIKNGDTNAFSKLVNKYSAALINSLYRITGNRETAEEIAQDAFYKIYISLDKYKKEYKFYTYLYRIAVNAALDNFRKNKKSLWNSLISIFDTEKYVETGISGKIQDEYLILGEQKSLIEKALAELNPRRRTAIVLAVYNNQSYREISRILNCSEKAVERLVSEARSHLKKKLENILGD